MTQLELCGFVFKRKSQGWFVSNSTEKRDATLAEVVLIEELIGERLRAEAIENERKALKRRIDTWRLMLRLTDAEFLEFYHEATQLLGLETRVRREVAR